MTHCPGCTGEARSSHSTYGHILGCGSMDPAIGHKHKHESSFSAESPVGDEDVEKVLTVAAKNLSNKALDWQSVATALRDALDQAWK